MNGKIKSFYGAKAIDEQGNEIAVLPNNTQVEVLDFGGNATGEYTKVQADDVVGWVRSAEVAAPLSQPEE